MPELPEVETVTNSVKKHLLKENFISLSVIWPKVLHNFSIADFNNKIKNKEIINVYRRGKFIVFDFDSCIMAVHLRMTGKLYVQSKIDKSIKHISAYLKFSDKYLIFEDTRKFGRFYLYDSIEYLNNKLGVEPFSVVFTEKWLIDSLKKKNRQMKQLLLDQSFVVGLGNIYTDEALWYAKIHPLSKSDSVPTKKVKKLYRAIKKVLSESIKMGGTTIRDYTYDYSYVGNYTLNLKAYGRNNKECERCNTLITKYKIAQRGTFVCTKCQKK
jgi:formamidopyrimidine-DNA glycosylase